MGMQVFLHIFLLHQLLVLPPKSVVVANDDIQGTSSLSGPTLLSKAADCDACSVEPMEHGFTESEDEKIYDCLEENYDQTCDILLQRCLKKCAEEKAFTNAGTDEQVLPVLTSRQQTRLQNLMRVEFNDKDLDTKVLDAIGYCAEGPPKADKFFFAKAKNRTIDDQFCSQNNSREFLTLNGIMKCKLYWTGAAHKASFFNQCLQKFPYDRLDRNGKVLVKQLRWTARKLQRDEKRAGTQQVAGGSTQVAGGILGTLGVMLAPITGGISAGLTLVGSVVGLTGEAVYGTARLGLDGAQVKTTRLSKSLHKEYEYLETIHMLYLGTVQEFDISISKIETKRDPLQRLLGSTAVGLNVGTIANRLLAKAFSKSKTAFPDSIKGITKISPKAPVFLQKLMTAKAAKIGSGAFATVTSALNMVTGIWNILEGKKAMRENLHSYEIFWKAKQLARTIDNYRATAKMIRGDDGLNSSTQPSDLPTEMFSIAIHTKTAAYLKVEIKATDSNGRDAQRCTTNDLYVPEYKFIDIINNMDDMDECAKLMISRQSNVTARVLPQENGRHDEAQKATKIDIAIDLSSSPTWTCKLNTSKNAEMIFQECGSSPSIWAVKFHTSESWLSGTDNSVKMTFKIYQWIENNGTKTIEDLDECQTNNLNNAGDDFERGQTDIFTAKQLGTCNDELKNFQDYYQKGNLKFKMFLDVNQTYIWKDEWNLDLIKIYFTTTFTEAIKGAHNKGRSQEEKMKDMSNYMICRHESWKPGQSYETSLYPTANYHAFDCEFNTILNPEVSLDRVKAHVCPWGDSGGKVRGLQLQLCRKYEWTTKRASKCCITNKIASKNVWADQTFWIDGDDINNGNGLSDGGQELGACEDFEFPGKEIYIKAWDDVGLSEYLCMDQLQFMGRGTSTDQEIPFATCSLATPNTGDYPGLWISGKHMYHGWNEGLPYDQAEPVKCEIADSQVQAIQLKVCQNLKGTKDAGVQGGNNITVRMVDEQTSTACETKNLVPENGLSPGEYIEIDGHSQIGGCKLMEFGHKLKMFVFNHGTDALCLQGLTVDVTKTIEGRRGQTHMYTCKLADDADFRATFTYGYNELSAIPLSCTSNPEFI